MFVHLGHRTVPTLSSLSSEHNPSRHLEGTIQAHTQDGFMGMVGERNGGVNIGENSDGDGFVDFPPVAMYGLRCFGAK